MHQHHLPYGVLRFAEELMGEDEERRGQDVIQKLTDDYVVKVEAALGEKDTDLLVI